MAKQNPLPVDMRYGKTLRKKVVCLTHYELEAGNSTILFLKRRVAKKRDTQDFWVSAPCRSLVRSTQDSSFLSVSGCSASAEPAKLLDVAQDELACLMYWTRGCAIEHCPRRLEARGTSYPQYYCRISEQSGACMKFPIVADGNGLCVRWDCWWPQWTSGRRY